jgi:hypothetical protein
MSLQHANTIQIDLMLLMMTGLYFNKYQMVKNILLVMSQTIFMLPKLKELLIKWEKLMVSFLNNN